MQKKNFFFLHKLDHNLIYTHLSVVKRRASCSKGASPSELVVGSLAADRPVPALIPALSAFPTRALRGIAPHQPTGGRAPSAEIEGTHPEYPTAFSLGLRPTTTCRGPQLPGSARHQCAPPHSDTPRSKPASVSRMTGRPGSLHPGFPAVTVESAPTDDACIAQTLEADAVPGAH